MTGNPTTDEELMLKLGRQDMSALGELVRRHQDRVLEIAFRTLGKWDLAEDVAQETFLRVHRAAGKYKPKARFTTWLYRIVVNLCLDEKRRRARDGMPLEDAALEAQAKPGCDLAAKKEIAKLVRTAVDGLPERQRIALVLHQYEGLSHSQIAEATGWTGSSVESLLVRAYANLRKKLVKMRYFAE
ncbi:MAG: sigma-70 family RNA polymerase sigma factor [Phycisphaerales bacterium]|nr:MAG: sigma-70 family RNA polymerase sigma factor [Phycisphaerales bacterium]